METVTIYQNQICLHTHPCAYYTSLVAQAVKCLSTMRETWVRALGWEDPLEKEMAIHSSTAGAAAAAKSLQSCLTVYDPIDSSPPGSEVPGILQARILKWVAISFSNAWKWTVKAKSLSCVRLFETQWTADYQAPLSMGFSRQEYWSGVPSPSP